jgi:hypothetical protein
MENRKQAKCFLCGKKTTEEDNGYYVFEECVPCGVIIGGYPKHRKSDWKEEMNVYQRRAIDD